MNVYTSIRLLAVVLVILLSGVGCSCHHEAVKAMAPPPLEYESVPNKSAPPLPLAYAPVPKLSPPPPPVYEAVPIPAAEPMRSQAQGSSQAAMQDFFSEAAPSEIVLPRRVTVSDSRRSLSPEEIRDLSKKHSKELKTANYDFRYKKVMKYDKDKIERQEPTLKISLRKSFDGNVVVTGNDGEIVGTVKVGSLVEATLEGGAFNIELLYPKEKDGRQILTQEHDMEWKWSISPKSEGIHPLDLYIKDIVVIDGDKPIFQTITTLHRVVNVDATIGEKIDDANSFIKRITNFILSLKGLLMAIIALAGILFYKKKRANPTQAP